MTNLHHAKNLDKADWRGTIFEGLSEKELIEFVQLAHWRDTIFEGRDWVAWVAEEMAKEAAAKEQE